MISNIGKKNKIDDKRFSVLYHDHKTQMTKPMIIKGRQIFSDSKCRASHRIK